MERGASEKVPQPDGSRDAIGSLLQKLRWTLFLVTIIPLAAFPALILYYVPLEVLRGGWVAALFIAVMALMLAGAMMIFRLTTAVAFAVGRRDAAAPSLYPDIHQGQPSLGGRSIRHTVAEALALTGAIPLLALGYIIVRYVLWIKTHESVLLIVGIVSVVLILGIIRINSLIRRLLSVAAAARSVRMETRVPGWDFGRDEIGALSADIAHIAEKLSTRMAELRRT